MFRHVVLLTFRDDAPEGHVERVAEALATLPAHIPELKSYVIGTDAGVAEGNADIAVVADCDDQAGWQAYRNHPVHLKLIAELIRPYASARSAVQHEL
jgi:hypothetical protein